MLQRKKNIIKVSYLLCRNNFEVVKILRTKSFGNENEKKMYNKILSLYVINKGDSI